MKAVSEMTRERNEGIKMMVESCTRDLDSMEMNYSKKTRATGHYY